VVKRSDRTQNGPTALDRRHIDELLPYANVAVVAGKADTLLPAEVEDMKVRVAAELADPGRRRRRQAGGGVVEFGPLAGGTPFAVVGEARHGRTWPVHCPPLALSPNSVLVVLRP
jgi:hypothetical protein